MRSTLIITIISLVVSCGNDSKKKDLQFTDSNDYQSKMILSHKEFIKKEKGKIDAFIDSVGLDFSETGTGLRYYIYESKEGESIKSKEFAFIAYTLTSLEGDTLYQSPSGKVQEFLVDYDNVESGLHEGIKKMRVGEKAYFILPAHLAHGISGDNAAISSQLTLLYNVHLVAKK